MQPTVSKHWEKLNDLNQEVYLLAASHVQLWPVVIDVPWFVSVSVSPTKKATPVYMPLGMWLGLAKDTAFYVGPRFPNGMGTSVGQPPVMWPFVKIFDSCYLIALLLIFLCVFQHQQHSLPSVSHLVERLSLFIRFSYSTSSFPGSCCPTHSALVVECVQVVLNRLHFNQLNTTFIIVIIILIRTSLHCSIPSSGLFLYISHRQRKL